jgi:hypothetical protein
MVDGDAVLQTCFPATIGVLEITMLQRYSISARVGGSIGLTKDSTGWI